MVLRPLDKPAKIGDILDRDDPERTVKCLFFRKDLNSKYTYKRNLKIIYKY
jgi:hypothetical protein